MPRLDVERFIEDLTGYYARNYLAILQDMVVAMAMGNKPAMADARKRMSEVIMDTMGTAEVLGASTVLQGAAGVMSTDEDSAFALKARNSYVTWVRRVEMKEWAKFANTESQTLIPRITFDEAVEDMVARTPTTIENAAKRTAQNIAKLYGEGAAGIPRIAFVRAAEDSVTTKVQGLIADAIKGGIPELDYMQNGILRPGAGTSIAKAVNAIRQESVAWSESYARMAFRTNVNTAVTAGRFRQAQDPDIKAVVPAFMFDSVGDSNTRANHDAGDGVVMLSSNPAWNTHAPPLGYSCRCGVRFVGTPELRRMGRVSATPQTGFTRVHDGLYVHEDKPPAGWHPDAGFRHGGRPDLMISGAT